MHEHPKKSFLFLVYFQNQKFFDSTIFSLSLWLLFLKKTNSEEEEKKKKKRGKKSFKFPVLPSLILYTHTQRTCSEKKEQNRKKKSCTLK